MRTLIAVAGLPGVGKSTISRAVQALLGAQTIDVDHFKKSMVDSQLVKEHIDPPEVRWAYYHAALEHAITLFDQGATNIIMDEVFHVQSLRARLEAYCAARQITVVWVEVVCPFEIVEARLKTIRREGHILSTEEALAMYKRFQELFEPFGQGRCIRLDNTEGVEPLVSRLLHALS